MSRTRIVYGLLILFGAAAFAHAVKHGSAPQEATSRDVATSADILSRRASLRATLKSQTDDASKAAASARPERQFSDKERADLRQQLRQQLAGQ